MVQTVPLAGNGLAGTPHKIVIDAHAIAVYQPLRCSAFGVPLLPVILFRHRRRAVHHRRRRTLTDAGEHAAGGRIVPQVHEHLAKLLVDAPMLLLVLLAAIADALA